MNNYCFYEDYMNLNLTPRSTKTNKIKLCFAIYSLISLPRTMKKRKGGKFMSYKNIKHKSLLEIESWKEIAALKYSLPELI